MWIDQIVDYEADARLVAVKTVSLSEEHLHDHFPPETAADGSALEADPVMPSSLIIEGMAQTAGVLVGSVNRFREKVVLAKVSQATIDADARAGDTLRYDARIDRIDAAGAVTRGTIELRRAREDAFAPVGTVDLMFSHLDQNLAGTEFPEENFVFSENFRTILRAAGLENLVEV